MQNHLIYAIRSAIDCHLSASQHIFSASSVKSTVASATRRVMLILYAVFMSNSHDKSRTSPSQHTNLNSPTSESALYAMHCLLHIILFMPSFKPTMSSSALALHVDRRRHAKTLPSSRSCLIIPRLRIFVIIVMHNRILSATFSFLAHLRLSAIVSLLVPFQVPIVSGPMT